MFANGESITSREGESKEVGSRQINMCEKRGQI